MSNGHHPDGLAALPRSWSGSCSSEATVSTAIDLLNTLEIQRTAFVLAHEPIGWYDARLVSAWWPNMVISEACPLEARVRSLNSFSCRGPR